MRLFIVILFSIFHINLCLAQINIDATDDATLLAQTLAGPGIVISNASLDCYVDGAGTFTNGNLTNLGIDEGIILTSGTAEGAAGPNTTEGFTGLTPFSNVGSPDLESLPGVNSVNNACVLEFDFSVSCADTVKFLYSFGSDEYMEFANTNFNDVFALFVNGPNPAGGNYVNQNLALLPNSNTVVSINNVNAYNNNAYYIDNPSVSNDITLIQYDGFTVVLEASFAIVAGSSYSLIIAIADIGDSGYDSGVFLQSSSLVATGATIESSANVNGFDNIVEGCVGGTINYQLQNPSATDINLNINFFGDAINGVDYLDQATGLAFNNSYTLPAGQTLATFTINALNDNLTEGSEEIIIEIIGDCGIGSLDTITITDNFDVDVSFTDTTICNGSAIELNALGDAANYVWSPNTNINDVTSLNPIINPSSSISYLLVGSTGPCSNTKTVNVTVVDVFPNAGNDQSICSGNSLSLNASGGVNYEWTPANDLSCTNCANPIFNGTNNQTYSVEVSTAFGCVASDEIEIIVYPTTNDVFENYAGCAGDGYSYTSPNGVLYNESNPNGTEILFDANACAYNLSVDFIYNNFSINCSQISGISAANQTDGIASININSGVGPFIIQYSNNNGIVQSLTTNLIGETLIPNLAPGNYNVTVNSGGCDANCSFTIDDIVCDVIINPTQSENILCNGDCNAAIQLSYSNAIAPITFNWTAPTFISNTTQNPSNLCAGTYQVEITDANNCTSNAIIFINEPNELSINCAQNSGISAPNQTDGIGAVNIAGGNAPYSISYTDDSGNTQIINSAPIGETLIQNLAAGNYNITITDANNCSQNCNFIIDDVACDIIINPTQSENILCNGDCNAAIQLSYSNAIAPITFDWTAPTFISNTTQNPSNLCAGTYQVEITDANNCNTNAIIFINEPNELSISCAQNSGISAPNQTDGIGAVNIAGGTAPFSISYTNDSGNTQIINSAPIGETLIQNLAAGNYNVTVTDANNCSQNCSFIIADIACDIILNPSQSEDVLCNGDCNAAIQLSYSNATAPITFNWTAPTFISNTTQNPSNLCAGTYQVEITDANNCNANAIIFINEPNEITISCAQNAGISAPNQTDGIGAVNIVGGNAPYSISYTNDSGNTQIINSASIGETLIGNLAAGNYNITVTDANNCSQNCNFIIDNIACSTTVSLSQTSDILCFGECTAAIQLSYTNAIAPITYNWTGSTSISNTTQNPTNLCAGNYQVAITDANNCIANANIIITEPNELIINCSVNTGISAPNQTDGIGAVNIVGGTAPFTINYTDDSGNSQTINSAPIGETLIQNLSPGNYNLTITDANNCSENCSFIIADIACGTTISLQQSSDILCFADCTATIQLTYINATSPIIYNWTGNTPINTTTQNPTNLCAGNYQVEITDANNCTANANIVISEPNELIINCAQNSTISAPNQTDGIGAVNIVGGNAPYSISYTNDSGNTQIINSAPIGETLIENLAAGNYNVTITDANNCSQNCNFIIDDIACSITVSLLQSETIFCFEECNAAIDLTYNNAANPIIYNWTGNTTIANTIQNPTNLCAGDYQVEITDANNCSANANITITQPNEFSITCTEFAGISAPNQTDGIGSVNIIGGTAPFNINYTENNGTTLTNNALTQGETLLLGLAPGNYDVVVSDANNCNQNCSFVISDVPCITSVSLTQSADILCFADCSAAIQLTYNNATTPIIYNWTGNTTITNTTQNPTDLCAGNYEVEITDANNCTANTNIIITEPNELNVTCSEFESVSAPNQVDGIGSVNIVGGIAPFIIDYTDDLGNTQSINAASIGETLIPNLAPGNYNVIITDANNCSENCSFNIADIACSTTISLQQSSEILCFGDCFASINLTQINAATPIIYNWTGNTPINTTTQNPTNLCAGNYQVEITDAYSCTASANITITEPNELTVNCTEFAGISAPNQTNGIGSINIVGGTAPFNIEYIDINGLTQINNAPTEGETLLLGLAPGDYNVTVSDANDCSVNCNFTISDIPCTTTVNLTQTAEILCIGDCTAEIELIYSNATLPIIYNWTGVSSIANTTQNPTNLCAGNYEVEITDVNNCTATANINIAEALELTLNCTQNSAISAPNQTDGIAAININNGLAPYTIVYTDDNGNSQSTIASTVGETLITNLAAGNYSVVVIDVNNCEQICSFNIEDVPCETEITLTQTATIDCNGNCNAAIELTYINATEPINYNWSGTSSIGNIQNPNNLCAGNYVVEFTDANDCIVTNQIEIEQPGYLAIACQQFEGISAPNQIDGIGSIDIIGGTPPFEITYTDGNMINQTITANSNENLLLTDLAAGVYTIEIVDANNCESDCNLTIDDVLCDLGTEVFIFNENLCFGDCNSYLELEVLNAGPTITYNWNGPTTIANISNPENLCAGNYEVNIIDNYGCETYTAITISEPTLLTVSCETISSISAPNQTDGIGSVSIYGGTEPYTINYLDGANNDETLNNIFAGETSITNLAPGICLLTVIDANNCEFDCEFEIENIPCSTSVTAIQSEAVLCLDDCTGGINITMTDFTAPVTFNWSGPTTIGNVQNPSDLCVGNYELEMIDNNGCIATTSINIDAPSAVELTCEVTSPISSLTSSDAIATISLINGVAPFYVSWTDNGSNFGIAFDVPNGDFLLEDLAPGNYIVSVSDSNICSTTCEFEVANLECDFEIELIQTAFIDCESYCTAAINTQLLNETNPINYSWFGNSNIGNIPNPENICAGVYQLIATDALGCIDTTNITISEPTGTEIICTEVNTVSAPNAIDGVASLDIIAGVAPFEITYSSNNTMVVLSNQSIGLITISNLEANDYFVSVIDANGCEMECSFTINNVPCLFEVNAPTNVSTTCFNTCDANIILDVINAEAPVTYNWQGPTSIGNIQNPENLCPGNYNVAVTDGFNCVDSISIIINEPASLFFECSTLNDISAPNQSDGTALFTILGGIAPYTINYDNGNNNNGTIIVPMADNVEIEDLNEGVYSITAIDALGCEQICEFEIDGVPCLTTVTLSQNNLITCFGDCTASLNATFNNFIPPVTLNWSGNGLNNVGNVLSLDSLCAGTYTVTMQDATGCSDNISITINEPEPLEISCSQNSPISAPSQTDGIGAVNIIGGTAPFFVEWTDGNIYGSETTNNNTVIINNLPAGTFNIGIIDTFGCSTFCEITISDVACTSTVSATQTEFNNCFGSCDAAIQVTTANTASPIIYNWNNGLPDTDNPIGLCAGIYEVEITDNNNCTASTSITIEEPSVINMECNQSQSVSYPNAEDGIGLININNGTAPYQISYNNGIDTFLINNVDTGDTFINNLAADDYFVNVIDNNGCEIDCEFSISNLPCTVQLSVLQNAYNQCFENCNAAIEATLLNVVQPVNFVWTSAISIGNIQNPDSLCAGEYSVVVTDASGCIDSAFISIEEPTPLAINCNTISSISQPNLNDGIANIEINGGTAPYNISWTNGNTSGNQTLNTSDSININNLSPGVYQVELVDDFNCNTQCSFTILDSLCTTLLELSTFENITCYNACDGSLELTINNATNPIEYIWEGPSIVGNTSSANNLCFGDYEIIAIDNNGCSDTLTYTLTQPTELILDCSQTNPVSAPNQNDGSVFINIQGGLPNYNLSYNTESGIIDNFIAFEGNNLIEDLASGNYDVLVLDSNNCQQVCEFYIADVPCDVSVNAELTEEIKCYNYCNASITINPINAQSPIIYMINDEIASNNFIEELCAGDYQIEMTDAYGCSASTFISIENKKELHLNIGEDVFVEEGQSYQFNTPIYNIDSSEVAHYLFDANYTLSCLDCFQPIAQPLENTIYIAEITNLNGCSTSDSLQIKIIPQYYVANVFSPNEDGVNDKFFVQSNYSDEVYQFEIYNRWGELIFQNNNFISNDPEQGWDGSFNGKPLSSNVFVFVVTIKLGDFYTNQIKGNVSLVR